MRTVNFSQRIQYTAGLLPKKGLILTAVLFVSILASCFNPLQAPNGTLTIKLGSGAGKAALYPPDNDTLLRLSHKIELSGNEGLKTIELAPGELSASVTLAPGQWEISVNAYIGDELYARGSSSVEVTAGENNPASVKMTRAEGGYTISGVVVTPGNIMVTRGLDHRFSAEVSGEGDYPVSVTWSVSGHKESATAINREGVLHIDAKEAPDTELTVTAVSALATVNGSVVVKVSDLLHAQPPVLRTQLLDATLSMRENAAHTLKVEAESSDGGTISYQWYRNSSGSNTGGEAIDGAVNASYEVPIAGEGSFYYYVEITNTIPDNGDGGAKSASVTSGAVTITVNNLVNARPPVIQSQPENATVSVLADGTHTLKVEAISSDGGTISYQWYRNAAAQSSGGVIIDGETGASYNAPIDSAGIYNYYVVVTNTISGNGDGGAKTASVRSRAATLVVNNPVNAAPPVIRSQPADTTVSVLAGGTHTLTVVAASSDGGTISYQWYRNTSPSTTEGEAVILGEESASYNAPIDEEGTVYYFVVVTNTISSWDGGTESASVTSRVVALVVNNLVNAVTPVITGPDTTPQNLITGGGATPLSVTVSNAEAITAQQNASTGSGTPGITYRWYYNTTNTNSGGTEISGATANTFTPPTTNAGTLYYYVVVTNTIRDNGDGGAKTAGRSSSAVMVTVTVNNELNPVEFARNPDSVVSGVYWFGLTIQAPAIPGGSQTYTYQWMSDGAIIPDQSAMSYTTLETDWNHEISVEITDTTNGKKYLAEPVTIYKSVTDTEGMNEMNNVPNGHYILDISSPLYISGGWTPPGSESAPFNGVFDGNGKSVNIGSAVQKNGESTGLFGRIGEDGVVKNLNVWGVSIASNAHFAGGVSGINDGLIKNVSLQLTSVAVETQPTLSAASRYYGGIAGQNNGIIENCYSIEEIKISASAGASNFDVYAGSIAGSNSGTITYCWSQGTVTAGSDSNKRYAGGIAGSNSGSINNCVALNEDPPLTGKAISAPVANPANNFLGRIAGAETGGGTFTGNYANEGMTFTNRNPADTESSNPNGKDGEDVTIAGTAPTGGAWWSTTEIWADRWGEGESTPWQWDSTTERPKLWFD